MDVRSQKAYLSLINYYLPEMTSGAAQFGDPQLVRRNSPSDIILDSPKKKSNLSDAGY